MPFKPDFSPTPRDPRLDPFRDAVAALELDERIVGYLATRVDPVSEVSGGHLWWTRWETPREVLIWLQSRIDPEAPLPEWDDGFDLFGDFLDELETGSIEVTDHRPESGAWEDREVFRYRLRWLSGVQRDEAWDMFGFGDTHIV